jgi:hypothetical protein
LFFVPGTNGDGCNGEGLRRGLHGRRSADDGSSAAFVRGHRRASTRIDLFGVSNHGKINRERLLFSGLVRLRRVMEPVVLRCRLRRCGHLAVWITSGNVAPGANDDRRHDVVMMDDFIYGEPQSVPQ